MPKMAHGNELASGGIFIDCQNIKWRESASLQGRAAEAILWERSVCNGGDSDRDLESNMDACCKRSAILSSCTSYSNSIVHSDV